MKKREFRHVDPDVGKAKARREMGCRGCGIGGYFARHHLVNRSQGGDDVENNLVPLCVLCHDAFHFGPNSDFVGSRIRYSLSKEETAYVVAKKGEWFLDRFYPTEVQREDAGTRRLANDAHSAAMAKRRKDDD